MGRIIEPAMHAMNERRTDMQDALRAPVRLTDAATGSASGTGRREVQGAPPRSRARQPRAHGARCTAAEAR